MSLQVVTPICRRVNCNKPSSTRALCKKHYDDLRKSQEKAKVRARNKELGEIPVCGLGILRCAVCNRVLADMPVSHTCLLRGVERIA